MAKSKKVPQMNPRERLTKKARAAISRYALIQNGDKPYHSFMVGAVLKAERMRRSNLYAWLEGQGYRWKPKAGHWVRVI